MHGIQDQADVDKIFAPGGAIEAFEAAKKAGKCRFFGFTGHHDPNTHVAMLKAYDKWDSILMPLHAADPAYLSFQKITLPLAVERGIGIQAMKVFANAFLLRVLNAGGMPAIRAQPAYSLRHCRLQHPWSTGRRRAYRPELQAVHLAGNGGSGETRRHGRSRRP